MVNIRWLVFDAVLGGILKEGALIAVALWVLPAMGYYLPLWVIVVIGLALAVQSGFSYVIAARLLKLKPVTGPQTMIGKRCVTTTILNPDGYVRIDGELWRAVSAGGAVAAGMTVLVVAVDGMSLTVRVEPSL